MKTLYHLRTIIRDDDIHKLCFNKEVLRPPSSLRRHGNSDANEDNNDDDNRNDRWVQSDHRCEGVPRYPGMLTN